MTLAFENDGDAITIVLPARIDAASAPEVEEALEDIVGSGPCGRVTLDCAELGYLASAGIRVVLRLAKRAEAFRMVNVSSEVYGVLDMTGITEMLEVVKAYREVSVEGCPVVGKGASGVVYRLDPETICKVYRNPDALPEIHRERELARAAFVAGIPTAISYDVVRVGDGFGAVFELLDASSLADELIAGRRSVEEVASEHASLLRQIAETHVSPRVMPSVRDEALTWVDDLSSVLPEATIRRLRELFCAVGDPDTMVHGDFHMKNVMVQRGECMLIDMDTLSHGDPVFDLASTFSAYVGRGLVSPAFVERFLGVPYEVSCHLWDLVIRGYVDGDEGAVRAVEDRVRLVSAVRLMGWPLRHGDRDSEVAASYLTTFGAIIDELLERVDGIAIA